MSKYCIVSTIDLMSVRNKELFNKEEYVEHEIVIFKSDVTAFRENGVDEGMAIDPNKCCVYLKSGEAFIINTPYAEIKKMFIP